MGDEAMDPWSLVEACRVGIVRAGHGSSCWKICEDPARQEEAVGGTLRSKAGRCMPVYGLLAQLFNVVKIFILQYLSAYCKNTIAPPSSLQLARVVSLLASYDLVPQYALFCMAIS
jgi:hypothetical protein